MIEVEAFCDKWGWYAVQPRAALCAYVASEVRRLDAEGKPILTTILRCGNDDAIATAMEMISTNTDGTLKSGKPLLRPRVWMLRLADDAVPPDLDPQGRPIDKERRGKVLIAKVGNLGGDHTARGGMPDAEWTGAARTKKATTRQDIYRMAEVTREPGSYALGDACSILRQWGVGIPTKQWRKAKTGNRAEHGQSQWLVEEHVEQRPAPAPQPQQTTKR